MNYIPHTEIREMNYITERRDINYIPHTEIREMNYIPHRDRKRDELHTTQR